MVDGQRSGVKLYLDVMMMYPTVLYDQRQAALLMSWNAFLRLLAGQYSTYSVLSKEKDFIHSLLLEDSR